MPTPQEIVDMHKRKEDNTPMLRIRWDDDLDRWNQKDYVEPNGKGQGYEQVTTNEFRVVGKKGISMISSAQMKLIVPVGDDHRTERDEDNAKEQFLRGNFKANDRRLIKQGQTGTLLQAISWYLNIRGTTIGRAMMRRRKGGATFAEAVPWDPRDCTWEYGPEGLAWICHKFAILREQIPHEWEIPSSLNAEQRVLVGLDWYDGEKNTVVIPDISLIKAVKDEAHGLVDGDGEPLVPGWVQANTLQPLITPMLTGGMNEAQLADGMEHFGESILADLRHPLESYQKLQSIRMEMASRGREPGYSVHTRDGNKTLDQAPYRSAVGVPLQHEDKIEVFDMLKMSQDSNELQALIGAESSKGGFPLVSFGSTGGSEFSGFAITQLKGGVADKVMGQAQAGSAALMTIAEIWADHYNTDAFDTISLSGKGRNRKWFSVDITPDQIRDLPLAEIELVPALPEDQAGKVNMASLLSKPQADGMPTLARQQISEDVLQRPDSDLDMDEILNMMGMSDEMVKAQRMTDALANRGDKRGAMIWNNKFKMLVALEIAKLQQLQQMGVEVPDVPFDPETDETRRNDDGEGGGFPPEIAPNSVQGQSPPTIGVDAPAQAGPVVAAGTPREGARNGFRPEGF